MPRRGFEPQWNGQRSTDYPMWRSRRVNDFLAIPLGFKSLPGHEISNCGSPLTSDIDSLSAIAY